MTPKTFNKMMSRWLENPETKGFSVKDYPDGTTYSGGASPFW